MAQCKFCGKDITFLKDGRRFIPLEGDGTRHSCEEMKNSFKSIKKMERNSLSPEEIKKYEEAINKGKK